MGVKSFALGYNACASQKGGSVSQAELEAAIKKVVPEWALEETPPKDAVTSVNGKVGAVNLPIPSEAADVKADPAGEAESMTNALREEVNTILGDYAKPTAIVDKIYWHNVSYMSHEDIRANVRTLRTMIETVVGTDTGKSMRAVAALVVAEIVGDASDSFDTLEEIAAWIEAHPNDVAAMVKRITDLETAMGGKVSKTDIINKLDSTALDKPLSAAMGAKLNTMLSEMSDELDGKATPEQVARAISDALTGYALKDHNHDGTYAKPADIPTKISQLAGDSTHRTVTDAEKTGWNGKADGSHNHDGVYAKPSDIPTVPQTLPNPYALSLLGKTYNGATAVSLTVEEIMEAIKTASGGVIAWIGDDNSIYLAGNLSDGTYKAYYEVDGEYIEIGDLTLGEEEIPEPDEPDTTTYFIDTTYLVACSSGNTNTEVEGGSMYATTISADEGYNLSAIRVKMGGEDITSDAVEGSTVTIENVTGDIAISCIGYKSGIRIYHGDGTEKAVAAAEGTGFIPVKTGDVVYIKNVTVDTTGNSGLAYYDSNKAYLSGYYLGGNSGIGGAVNGEAASFNVTAANAAYIRFSALVIDSTSIITVNEQLA